ncbi:MAG: hypothetical protein JWO86_6156, partial [Myxococcaceae bacterium]|nr:hypothetical protein [Myxococcaceae bacterium]
MSRTLPVQGTRDRSADSTDGDGLRTLGYAAASMGRLSRPVTLFFGLCASSLASCSLLVATDGLTGGGGNDAALDTESEETDGATSDRGDGRAGTDAVLDEGTSPSFCASLMPAPVYCVDFDDGRDLGVFGVLSTPPPSRDSTRGLSGAASMLVQLPATGDGQFSIVTVSKDFNQAPFRNFSIAMSLHLDDPTSATYTEFTAFKIIDTTQNFTLLLAIAAHTIEVFELHGPAGTENGVMVIQAALPSEEWVTVRLEGTVSGPSAGVVLFLDGAMTAANALPTAMSGAQTAGTLVYGAYFHGQNQPAKAY